MIVDELVALFRFDIQGEQNVRRFNEGLKNAEQQANHVVGAIGKLAAVAAGAFAAIGGARLAGDFVASITQVNAQFESYEATLKTLTGSAEAASTAMDWISDFARTTPYDVAQVTESFVRLKSYGLDPTDGSLRTVGDAASAMGKSLMAGVEAIADAVTGENERLKEFGVTSSVAGDKVTYNWTENGKKLSKTVSKDAAQIQAALMEIFGRFSGAMDDQSRTWSGMTSNMAENWTDFLRAIGEAGYFDDIKRRLGGLMEFAEAGWTSGTFDRIAQRVSDGLIGAMNVTTHLATQAYRIGRGFYYAADGIVDLTSRLTGLNRGMAAAGLGAGLVASSAMGRTALLAIARRVPMVAAALALDDIISGLNGDDSVIGSLEGGQAALDRIKASFGEIHAAADEVAGSLNAAFGIDAGSGSQLDALMASANEFVSGRVVQAFSDFADRLQIVATALREINAAIQDPAAAFQRFADAAIQQIDRLIAAIDEKLGGALTRYGLIGGGAVAQDNPNAGVRSTGTSTSAPRQKVTYEPDASLIRDGMTNAEGLRVEYGVSENKAVAAATTIANIMSSISSFEGIATAVLKADDFINPGNQALAIQADLNRGINATATLDVEPWLAQVARAQAALETLKASGAARVSAGGGLVARPPAREVAAGAQP